jgi:hypothetical protein
MKEEKITGGKMETNTTQKLFWVGKKAKIEILKDGVKLIYTADILEFGDKIITFRDRAGIVFSFNISLIQELKVI